VSALLTTILLLAQPATAQPPANQTPALLTPPADPASSVFTAATGLLLATIKPASAPDYELVMRTLQAALAADRDPARAAAAKGWRVFKAAEGDAKGNTLYVHLLAPAQPGFDYRPSLLIDELVADLAPDLLSRYQDAFAAPPTKLNLTEFAHMAVAPVEIKKPGG
jgi:hypothetical protein